jgi:GNAT superfamily N-acetyltransferase
MSVMTSTMPTLCPVAAADFDDMVALRIEALRESLERLGRFDSVRARERLAAGFKPEYMQHIELKGDRIGFITLRPDADAVQPCLHLDHLYIRPAYQGQGVGAWTMDWVKAQADIRQLPVTLSALRESAANRFYQRHGFAEVASGEFDVDYCRMPAAHPSQVVSNVWSFFQARDWAAARALMHDDLQVQWWASGETLHGADTYIAVNAEYPEGWTIHLVETSLLADGRVLALARVDHPPHATFLVQQIMRVRDGRLLQGTELWATCEAAPAWRTPESYAGISVQAPWPPV